MIQEYFKEEFNLNNDEMLIEENRRQSNNFNTLINLKKIDKDYSTLDKCEQNPNIMFHKSEEDPQVL